MIVVKMKVYHCTNAEDNPIPVWMQMKTQQKKMPKKKRNGYCGAIQTKS